MAFDSASQLGGMIGGLSNDQSNIKEDILEDETDQSLLLTPIDRAKVETTVIVYKRLYSSTSFLLDHPVYGELDSSTLELDGGYLETEGTTFPMTFPFTFAGGGESKILWDTYTG